MANQLSESFSDLRALAQELRDSDSKYIAIFAHNGVGKTSLSVDFKNIGKNNGHSDTLYYNAFTEDLFYWDNDLANDEERVLIFRRESHFFNGLDADVMENKIRSIMSRYANFDFSIQFDVPKRNRNGEESPNDQEQETINYITFRREYYNEETSRSEWNENIKISRGEECIFKWCFFLTIVQMVVDNSSAYNWVKYIFVDDPVSSLDDNNTILVANHLAVLLKRLSPSIHTVISTHHGLFFNAICNELSLKDNKAYYLYREDKENTDTTLPSIRIWRTKKLKDTPFFQHLSLIKELDKAVSPDGNLFTYHFNMLRNVLEKTAAFHGLDSFSKCIKKFEDDPDEQIYARMINILSHGNYSIFEPIEMSEDNKIRFKIIYRNFKTMFPFKENL